MLLGGCAVSPETDDVAQAAEADPVVAPAADAVADAGELAVAEPAAEPEPEPVIEQPEEVPADARPATPTGDVVWIQRRLKDLGYYSGPIDGDAGGATRRAIREYQADQGLTTTGIPTPELQDFMWRNGG